LWNKKTSENDPDYSRQLRQEAGRNIEENRLSYPQIQAQYQHLINRALITNHDINELLKVDLNLLSYPQFIQKHSSRIIPILRNHPQNFQAIQNKYLQYLENRDDFPGIRTLPFQLETSVLAIGYDQLAARFANAEALREDQNYERFIVRNGLDILPYVTEEAAIRRIESLFLEQAAYLNKGVIAALREYSTSLEKFSGDLRDRMTKMIVEQEIQQFMDDRLSYPLLRERNGLANITSALAENPIKNKAREFILSLSYRDMNSPAYAEDRALLEITNEDILKAAYKQAERLPYFGKNGFKETYGVHMLRPERMSESHVQRIKNELVKQIMDCSYGEITACLPEFARFNLTINDVLRLRWENKPIKDIIAQESHQFFDAIPGMFSPRSWTNKVLEEAKLMSVGQLLKVSPNFFTRGILQANDTQEGISLQTKFEKEITTVTTFEVLINTYGCIIFQYQLVRKENNTLDKLIKDFLYRNSFNLIRDSKVNGKTDYLGVISQYKLLKKSFQDYLEEAKTAVEIEEQKYQNAIDRINNTFQENDKINRDACEAQKSSNTLHIRKELDLAEQTFRASNEEKQRIDAQVKEQQITLESVQKKLKTLNEDFDSQVTAKNTLKAKLNSFPASGDVRFLTNNLNNLIEDISRKTSEMITLKNHIKQSLNTDTFIVNTKHQIQMLNMNLDKLEREKEARQRELNSLEIEYSNRRKELASLEQAALNRGRENSSTMREPLNGRRELATREREPLNGMREREPLNRDSERREVLDARLTTLRRDGGELESKLMRAKAMQTSTVSSQTTIKNEIQQFERHLSARLQVLESNPRPDQLKQQIDRSKQEQESKENQLRSVKEILRQISSADAQIHQFEKEKESAEQQQKSIENSLAAAKKHQTLVEADHQKASAAVQSKTQQLHRTIEPYKKNYQLLHQKGDSQRIELLKKETERHEVQLTAIDTNFRSKLAPA
jgi:hypothetical protein